MKTYFGVLALVPVLGFAASSHASDLKTQFENDRSYLTVGSAQIEELADNGKYAPLVISSLDQGGSGGALGEVKEAIVVIDEIINLGKRIWDLVASNQPVVTTEMATASALPMGVTGWENLERWSAPVSKLYRMHYENLYGMTVVDFTYRVVYTAGGSYQGKGAFLTGVTAMPASLRVSWGYKFDMKASVPQVLNAGTKTDPVAAAQIRLDWKVHTIISHDEGSSYYSVRGDGAFQDLSQLR
jgi:hypothetical protein